VLAQTFVTQANPYLILGSSAVALWLFIWGGIRMWHRQAAKTLEGKFDPYFEKIDNRLDDQDALLENVNKEVTLNGGASLKDGMRVLTQRVNDVMDALITKPATALAPYPALGLIDALAANGRSLDNLAQVVDLLAKDIKPDNGSTGRDLLNQISDEQTRVGKEKGRDDRTRGHV
jgi:hypothetical protein